MEILLWMFVGAYLLAASYALAETLNCKHTLTRGWLAKARVALGAVVWPAETLWLELPQYFSAQWQAATPRYQEVAS